MSLLPGATFQPLFLPRLGGGDGHFPLPLGPAMILFVEADSPACDYAARAVARLGAALGPRGLEVMVISRSGPEETAAFVARNGLSGSQVGLDLSTEPATNEFELDRVPSAFVVDQGTVLACVEGWSRRDFNALAAAADVVGAPAPTASDPGDGMPDYEPGEARP